MVQEHWVALQWLQGLRLNSLSTMVRKICAFLFFSFYILLSVLFYCMILALTMFPFPLAVDAGNRAVIFDKIQGVQSKVVSEGTHFRIPYIQVPIIMDIRSRPRIINSSTGTKDLQMVELKMKSFRCIDLLIMSEQCSHHLLLLVD